MSDIVKATHTLVLELESWLEIYRVGLQEIADAEATSHHVAHLSDLAQKTLDGDVTSTDILNSCSMAERQDRQEYKIHKIEKAISMLFKKLDMEIKDWKNTVLISDINKEIAEEWTNE